MTELPDVESIVARLRSAGCVYAEEEAAVLLADDPTVVELEGLIARRVAGEPLEHVVGWAEFCGFRVHVRAGVFVPRRRSELLAREAIATTGIADLVVELCCGAAAVGMVLMRERSAIELHAADLDPVAVDNARLNLPAATVHQGDLFDALPPRLRGCVDVIVANAPYVPTDEIDLMPAEARLHEPVWTLDGGPDGLAVQRRLIAAAPAWLRDGGTLLIETSQRQGVATADAMRRAGFGARVAHDDDLGATVVIGTLVSSDSGGGPPQNA